MNILVMAPHTDDEVIGCGGIISRYIREGHTIKVIAFSHIFSGKTLLPEFRNASKILGLSPKNISNYNFTPRYFQENRQQVRDAMMELRNIASWDWIFVPQQNDPHQDHQVITEEAIRIFNKYTLLGYEGSGKSRKPVFDLVIKLEKDDINKKIKAFEKFKSQEIRYYYQNRRPFFLGRAADRGMLIETLYAEAFEVIRMVG